MLKVALVICTYNRAAKLRSALKSVALLEYPIPWELVIVNNNSSDNTEETINSFKLTFHQKLISVFELIPGLGRARNMGWRATSSDTDVIAFIDDDCYPSKNFLLSIIKPFEENKKLGFTGGRILGYNKRRPSTSQYSIKRIEINPGQFLQAGLIIGANFAFRRSALLSVNGFDNYLGTGTSFLFEDIDIMARMLIKGWVGVYDPRSYVYHDDERNNQQIRTLVIKYTIGYGAYFIKYSLCSKFWRVYLTEWVMWCIKLAVNGSIVQLFYLILGSIKFIPYLFKRKRYLKTSI